MTTNSIPTDLRLYSCDSCDALLFTNKLWSKDDAEVSYCKSCGSPYLTLLEKESFNSDNNYLSLPLPQRLLVKNFFEYAHDRYLLLSKFSQVPPLDIISQDLEDFILIREITIEITPDLQSTASVFFADGTNAISKGPAQLLIEYLKRKDGSE